MRINDCVQVRSGVYACVTRFTRVIECTIAHRHAYGGIRGRMTFYAFVTVFRHVCNCVRVRFNSVVVRV